MRVFFGTPEKEGGLSFTKILMATTIEIRGQWSEIKLHGNMDTSAARHGRGDSGLNSKQHLVNLRGATTRRECAEFMMKKMFYWARGKVGLVKNNSQKRRSQNAR